METKNIILKLRTERGMSQDELADKIMVTRQAVSRWEHGDAIPNTDTLKLLSKEFDVSINTLLGEPRKLICQCCGMPIDDDSILGRDKDGTLNEEYCKWCYADGTYTYNNMDELIDVCVKNMVNENFTEEQARSYLKEMLPKLDYWKRYDELSDNGQFEEFKKQLMNEINDLHIDGLPRVDKAFFISPIVDMEKLILDMMGWADITEEKLREKQLITTGFGETLSWEYLCYVRNHPVNWSVPTYILYGDKDNLTSQEIIHKFANDVNAELTIMQNGEHWFHTAEQMSFLDDWIKSILDRYPTGRMMMWLIAVVFLEILRFIFP